MSKLGEVVYCVACDRARTAEADVAAAGSEQAPAERPRRMATKRDANGEPLCTACLDARLASRRAEFMLNQGRAPLPSSPPAQTVRAAESQPASPRRPAFIRIVRQQETPAAPERKPPVRTKRAAREVAPKPAEKRTARRGGKMIERRFVMLLGEMGFLRAQQLLNELKTRARK